jgi:predicted nucleotidyltransferase
MPPSTTPIAAYRRSAQARHEAQRAQLDARRQRARQVAQQAAARLKQEFAVDKVALFGSVVQPALFHIHSDIDLAVWGLDERRYFRAVGMLQGLDSEFAIDLVPFEDAAPSLQHTITQEGEFL